MEEKKPSNNKYVYTSNIPKQTYSVIKHNIVLYNKIRTKHHPIYISYKV